jgi:uncharacterized protein (DUF2236 family)
MKQKDLEKMKALHSALFQQAENQLKNFYNDMHEKQQDRWFEELKKQRSILNWLAQQQPDDE